MKLNLKSKALSLRKDGFSIKDIAAKLNISTSTASLWCRNIQLSRKQKENLESRTNRKLQKFFKMVEKQKENRQKVKNKIQKTAKEEIGSLSKRDLFIAGVSLYWAEGFKHEAEGRVGFCNSDPLMMKFMQSFLKKCLGVKNEEISPRLTLNEAFKDKTEQIQQYWSEYLNIPVSQFTKPFYQKVKQVKVYANGDNYHGVLRIHVRKSSVLLLKMRGYLESLRSAY